MSTDVRPSAIFLMGPTASGKTALACELATRFRVGLVSVDSALVYRGLDIGSAKPDAATRARFPHALIDIRDPAQPYSAADFRVDALAEMRRLDADGKIPLLVGGTGLYFRALQSGLSELPAADPALRAEIGDTARRDGWQALHERLRALDPDAAARIRPGDAQRKQRALEVITVTGRPLSQQQGGVRARLPFRVLKLALSGGERGALHARIAARVDAMLAQGLIDEVAELRARGAAGSDPGQAFHADLPAMRAVGYRQAWQHLDGEFDAAALRERVVFATRQLAKRQLTWLRSELDARVLDPFAPGHAAQAQAAVAAFLER
jgi:tRNA dimethylallyltransferase